MIFVWSANCSVKHFPQGQSMEIFYNLPYGPAQISVPSAKFHFVTNVLMYI